MGNSDILFESIFKRALSDADTRDYLTQITNEYPYFSVAQFFLLLQSEKGTAAYQQQLAKTSVLFNNPYWLQFQMQQNAGEPTDTLVKGHTHFLPPENQERVSTEVNKTPENGETAIIHHPGAEEIIAESIAGSNYQEALLAGPEESAIRFIEERDLETTVHSNLPLHTTETTQEPIAENYTEPITGEQIIASGEIKVDGMMPEAVTETVLEEPAISSPPENEKEIIIEKEFLHAVNDETAVSNEPEKEAEIIDTPQSGHFNNENEPLVNEAETEDEPITEKEIEPLNFKLNMDTSNTTEDIIIFEPLHTSDYFASLGIKLSGEVKPSDKLGTQLKSFTEWLKTMKKIHGGQLPQQSGHAEISIQKLAEQSNKEAVVVTEAMADVLLQQGKADKAIEVYKKLSLLNPSKSAYFAAKIDQLKEH